MARYPAATWRGPIPNVGGQMGAVTLGVVHIMDGTLTGTDSWFHNPQAQASAHFGISKAGAVFQWVDTDQVAWAEASYNGHAISIEHEGYSGEQLTSQQLFELDQLIRWVRDTHGLPAVRGPASGGWVGHGELGVAGGNHPDCPGVPILAQLDRLLAPKPDPQPQQESVFMIPTGCTDEFAFNAQVREWWEAVRTDPMLPSSQGILWWQFNLPTAKGGWQGNPDLVLAWIIDTAGPHRINKAAV